MKAKKSPSLTFENLYSVKGLLKDGKGNEFLIYVSGKKREVDKFIQYQRRQLKKGILGIRATVEPDSSKNELEAKRLYRAKRTRDEKLEMKSGKVKIGITRQKIVTKRPYKITYHIDPKIKTPPTQTGTPIPDFEFEFGGSTADVNCTVLSGKVQFSLVEIGVGQAGNPITIEDIPNQNTGALTGVANANKSAQKWRIEALGKRPGKESTFELEYTKKIT